MASLGNGYENKVLDKLLNATDFTSPATLYMALYTAAPTDAGGGTEVSGGSYARVSKTANTTNFPAASSGAAANGTAITFPTATAGWGTVTHWALHDHATNDSVVLHGALTMSRVVISGDTPAFAIGEFDITAA